MGHEHVAGNPLPDLEIRHCFLHRNVESCMCPRHCQQSKRLAHARLVSGWLPAARSMGWVCTLLFYYRFVKIPERYDERGRITTVHSVVESGKFRILVEDSGLNGIHHDSCCSDLGWSVAALRNGAPIEKDAGTQLHYSS